MTSYEQPVKSAIPFQFSEHFAVFLCRFVGHLQFIPFMTRVQDILCFKVSPLYGHLYIKAKTFGNIPIDVHYIYYSLRTPPPFYDQNSYFSIILQFHYIIKGLEYVLTLFSTSVQILTTCVTYSQDATNAMLFRFLQRKINNSLLKR